jgi:hypothetical protein
MSDELRTARRGNRKRQRRLRQEGEVPSMSGDTHCHRTSIGRFPGITTSSLWMEDI